MSLKDMGKKTEIKETVMEELENIQTDLAPRLQSIYDDGFHDGAESRETEVQELKTKITNMQTQINNIIKALGSE